MKKIAQLLAPMFLGLGCGVIVAAVIFSIKDGELFSTMGKNTEQKASFSQATSSVVTDSQSELDHALSAAYLTLPHAPDTSVQCDQVTKSQFVQIGDAVMARLANDEYKYQDVEHIMGGANSVRVRTARERLGRMYSHCPFADVQNDPMMILALRRETGGASSLTDSNGIALYVPRHELLNTFTCKGSCLENWQPYTVKLSADDVATIYTDFRISSKYPNGQLVERDQPLFYNVHDQYVGNTTKDDVFYPTRP